MSPVERRIFWIRKIVRMRAWAKVGHYYYCFCYYIYIHACTQLTSSFIRESSDFGDEFDVGFSYDKDLVQKTKKPYEVDFKVLSPSDIDREQNYQIGEVSSVLGLPPESAGILLRFARWNREKLIESYMDRSEELLEEAGLGDSFEENPRTETVPGFACSICCEDDEDLETYAMRCGHRFCVDCFRHYLVQKIKEEGEAARIQCPQDHCHRIVDSKSLDLLVTDDLKDR